MKFMEYEVEGPRPRGRPKRTWREVVREDCQACKLKKEDAWTPPGKGAIFGEGSTHCNASFHQNFLTTSFFGILWYSSAVMQYFTAWPACDCTKYVLCV